MSKVLVVLAVLGGIVAGAAAGELNTQSMSALDAQPSVIAEVENSVAVQPIVVNLTVNMPPEAVVEQADVQTAIDDSINEVRYVNAVRGLRGRGGPGTDSLHIANYQHGQSVVVTGYNGNGTWANLSDGTWVSNAYLSDSRPAMPVRSAPVSSAAPAAQPVNEVAQPVNTDNLFGIQVVGTPFAGAQVRINLTEVGGESVHDDHPHQLVINGCRSDAIGEVNLDVPDHSHFAGAIGREVVVLRDNNDCEIGFRPIYPADSKHS